VENIYCKYSILALEFDTAVVIRECDIYFNGFTDLMAYQLLLKIVYILA